VIEALLGGAIDIGSLGPSAVVLSHARHPGEYRVLTGVASGGASFVVTKASGIASTADLRGKSFATPQLGSTQDVSLRKFLRAQNLETRERGGDVTVYALASADIRTQMMRGQLAGAWLPEPWATRVVGEGIATRFIDERDLWPDRKFSTALVTARTMFVDARPDDTARFVAAVKEEVARAIATPASTEQEAYDEITRLTTNAGPRPLFHDATAYVDFTSDPLASQVAVFARDAADLGLIEDPSCDRLFAA
jgi:NitT/TauT family transport system substrate-binding protein